MNYLSPYNKILQQGVKACDVSIGFENVMDDTGAPWLLINKWSTIGHQKNATLETG